MRRDRTIAEYRASHDKSSDIEERIATRGPASAWMAGLVCCLPVRAVREAGAAFVTSDVSLY